MVRLQSTPKFHAFEIGDDLRLHANTAFSKKKRKPSLVNVCIGICDIPQCTQNKCSRYSPTSAAFRLKCTPKFHVLESSYDLKLQSQRYEFVCPDEDEMDFLTNFSIFCIDQSYGTRTCNDTIAYEFFEISKHEVQAGFVEKLIDADSKLFIGFYSLTKRYMDENSRIIIELGSLFVNPTHHRVGIGSVLFRRAISQAISFGCNKLQWISHPNAAAFYKKCGATTKCNILNVLNPDIPAPWFELELS
jgi:GNAT superfamily N-acetyltransferase